VIKKIAMDAAIAEGKEIKMLGYAHKTPILEDLQPAPTKNDHPASWSLVIADMAQRDIMGAGKYGTRLQPNNGRDALLDAYQEALDLTVYLRSAIYERDGK